MEPSALEVLTFDEDQKLALGRALMAVANQVFDQPKIEVPEPIAYQEDEVIELLSDSDNENQHCDDGDDEDFEMFGKICANGEELTDSTPLETHILSATAADTQAVINEADIEDVIISNVSNSGSTPFALDEESSTANQSVLSPESVVIARRSYKTTTRTTRGAINEIIVLDDDDCDDDGDGYLEEDGNEDDNFENSDDEKEEKKFINLLEINSDDDDGDANRTATAINMNTHNLEAFIQYICPQCGIACENLKKWNAHTDIVHNFRSISTLNMKTVISRQGRLCYKCNSCEKHYETDERYGVLLKHRITHMPIPGFLRCRLCQKRFRSRSYFLGHMKRAHPKIAFRKLRRTESFRRHVNFFCPICKEKADCYKMFSEHLEDEHDWYNKLLDRVTNIRNNMVECKECSGTFGQRNIKFHMLRHEEHKPFQCKICNIEGHNLNQLAKHVRFDHLNEKKRTNKFLCQYCDTVLPTSTRRAIHTMEMHTIEKVKCNVCKKKFNSTARLLVHMAKLNHQKIK